MQCLESLKKFEEYRSFVGGDFNGDAIAAIERLKFLQKPYNALKSAELKILPLVLDIPMGSKAPQNLIRFESLNMSIEKKKRELELALTQLREIQKKVADLSNEIVVMEIERVKVMLKELKPSSAQSMKPKEILDNLQNQLKSSILDLNQCLEVVHSWLIRLIKQIPSLISNFDQLCISFLSNSTFEIRDDTRDHMIKIWDKIHGEVTSVRALRPILLEWKRELNSSNHNIFSTYQNGQLDLLYSLCQTCMFSFIQV
jgi:hypothetical protein